jgi:hypothetical protein
LVYRLASMERIRSVRNQNLENFSDRPLSNFWRYGCPDLVRQYDKVDIKYQSLAIFSKRVIDGVRLRRTPSITRFI